MKDVWLLLKENRGAMIGLALILISIVIALFAPLITAYEPTAAFPEALKVPPGFAQHWLGTDDLGRDLFSRLVYGSRVSLSIGFFVVVFTAVVGTFLGLLAGSFGGWVDAVVMRSMDILMALPTILLAIVVVSILGPGLLNTVLAVGIVSLPSMVRLIRATVLVEKGKNYVMASRSFGANWWQIYVIGILPNCLAPLLVQATFGFSDGILSAAALGFLGLGAQPPISEWGTMLSDGRSYIESASWLVTLPGLCILVVVIAFNLFGDGLRDAFDPKVRQQ
jgi:ABC-type dipeptide/oligopeptide/nickel transport system permease subunit